MIRFPAQLGVRLQTLWALWIHLPAKRDMSEAEVNSYIAKYHTFADNATLRRELVNAKLLWRTQDGRIYRKVTREPDADTVRFLKVVLGGD